VKKTDDGADSAAHAAQIGQLLRRAYSLANKHSSAALQDAVSLTPVQASAMLALAERDLSQVELGRWIDMEPANVHGLVRRLETIGMISIRPDDADSRRSRIALTPVGRRAVAPIKASAARSAEATLARLDVAERTALVGLLIKLLG